MSEQVMFCLVGEQPIANYLPIRHKKPKKVVLLYSAFTQQRAERLALLLKAYGIEISDQQIEPYALGTIIKEIGKVISKEKDLKDDLCFNLTGGTKPMCIGAYHLCLADNIPYYYLQSEGGKSLFHVNTWQKGRWQRSTNILNSILTIDEYLKLHISHYTTRKINNPFEEIIYNSLINIFDETACSICLSTSLEVDLVFRIDNQIGIAEVKTGRKALSKEGIDQLNTAAGREYLGTYTKKFLIIDREYEQNNKILAKERNIHVLELKESSDSYLSPSDEVFLKETIKLNMLHS